MNNEKERESKKKMKDLENLVKDLENRNDKTKMIL